MIELSVGSASASQNGKGSGFLPVDGLPEQAYPPIVIIRGQNLSPLLTVTGGIHGCEYSSIEAVKQIAEELQPEDLVGTVLACPIANMVAFFAHRAFVNPSDEKNLNRVFPGDPGGSSSERLAYQVAQSLIQPADAYIDLHGGDLVEALVPFTLYQPGPTPEIEQESRKMALWFGIPHIIRTRVGGSAYECAVNMGKPAILAEAGQQGILSKEAVALLKQGVFQVLQGLGCLTQKIADKVMKRTEASTIPKMRVFQDEDWVRSPARGMWYPAVSCGDTVQKGQVLGVVCSFFGERLASIQARNSGPVLFLLTSLAVSEGDSLLSIACSPEET